MQFRILCQLACRGPRTILPSSPSPPPFLGSVLAHVHVIELTDPVALFVVVEESPASSSSPRGDFPRVPEVSFSSTRRLRPPAIRLLTTPSSAAPSPCSLPFSDSLSCLPSSAVAAAA